MKINAINKALGEEIIILIIASLMFLNHEIFGHEWAQIAGWVFVVVLTALNIITVIGEYGQNTIKFYKLPNVITPTKRREDAGYDIYANIKDFVAIHPNETVMVPTGLHSSFSSKYAVILKERGSTGTLGIGQRSGVIDSGYRGEWLVPLTNHSNKTLVITPKTDEVLQDEEWIFYPASKAICQAVVVPVPEVGIKTITEDKFKKEKSERGTGRLGSSGK